MAQIDTSTSGTHRIVLDESFDFENHREFREFWRDALAQKAKKIVVDFANVKYIDSSALGMLMLVKHEVDGIDCQIELTNVSGHARNILQLVKFDDKFDIK